VRGYLGGFGVGAGQIDRVHPAREGEHGGLHGPVSGIGDDAALGLPDPLPAGPLLWWQVLVVGAHRTRVGDQAFLAGGDVQRPQAADRVRTALGTQEDDKAAIR